jgi:ribose transport system ATP-binding protein
MKCLTGVVQPDAGQVLVDGEPVRFSSPSQALDAGVRVVYQELSLFPTLSVAENIVGAAGAGKVVRWKKVAAEARAAMRSVGVNLDLDRAVGQLAVGEQQIVEIVRAVRSRGRVLILDEPTSALGREQADHLFELLDNLAAAGNAVVFVTQDFGDALRHADVIRVMREGRLSQEFRPGETTSLELIHAAFGADRNVLESTYESGHVRLPARNDQPVVLDARGIQSLPMVGDMSLTAHRGEVVGLYGGLDSGHLAFAQALVGARNRSAGKVSVGEKTVGANNPAASVKAGIGYLSADRREGLALSHDVADNVTLANLTRMSRWLVPARKEQSVTKELIDTLRIRSARPDVAVDTLSGGNQQKVLFARWMLFDPEVLVLVEPTRGMDIAAKSDVIRIIRERAEQGTAVVVVSAEAEIVLSVSDRVLVARKGGITREFVDEEVSVSELVAAATG